MKPIETDAITARLPLPLRDALIQYLENTPDQTLDNIAAAAFSLFLLQNGTEGDSASYRQAARHYIDATFRRLPGGAA